MTDFTNTLSRRMALSGAAAAASSLVLGSRARADAPTKVRLGIVSALFDSGSVIAFEKGYFRERGLDVEIKVFPGTADANQALSIGALDVIESGVSPALFNARMRHIDMNIVASAGVNTPGHGTISIVLRKSLIKSGRYKGPADLKGLRLSTGLASPAQWLPAEMAQSAGVDARQINFAALGIGNTVSAMVNGAIDGGSVNEPFATLLVDRADGVRVASMDQKFPGFPSGYLIYGPSLTKKNVDAGKRYMLAYFKAMRDYQRAFGPQRQGTADILAMLRKHDIQVTADTPSLGVTDDLAPSFAFVDRFVDWQIAQGNMRGRIDPRALVDDRFRQFALQQFKR